MKRSLWHYIGYGLAWTAGVTLAGALAGAVFVPLVGAISGSRSDVLAMAVAGCKNLGFLAFVWAPGVGIVMAFHRAYRDHCDDRGRAPD